MPTPKAAAARVALTPLRPEDSDALFRWINDRELVILNAPFAPVARPDHDAWFERIRDLPDVRIFAIRTLEPEGLIGTCQLHSIDSGEKSAELQIRIGEREAQGRGYGSEAVRLLLDTGFGTLGLERIYLHVFEDNARAIATYRKAGFVDRGISGEPVLIEGREKNVMMMDISKDEHVQQAGRSAR